jgi:hypothetical protein
VDIFERTHALQVAQNNPAICMGVYVLTSALQQLAYHKREEQK